MTNMVSIVFLTPSLTPNQMRERSTDMSTIMKYSFKLFIFINLNCINSVIMCFLL